MATRCSTTRYIMLAALARGRWSSPTKILSSWCAPRTTSLLFKGAGAPLTRPARGWNPPAPPPVSTAASMSNSLSSSFLFVMRWGGEDCLLARACSRCSQHFSFCTLHSCCSIISAIVSRASEYPGQDEQMRLLDIL